MRRKDRYQSYAELCQHERENRDFCVLIDQRASPVAVLAPHGGNIERGTSALARELAGDDFSLYRFTGMRNQRSRRLHLTSTNFDEPHCLRLLPQHELIVTVHGCSGEAGAVYIGGLAAELKSAVFIALRQAGFGAEIVQTQNGLAGRDPRNLCNRGRSGQGLQLELDSALRRAFFERAKGPRRNRRTPAFHGFIHAVRAVLDGWVYRRQVDGHWAEHLFERVDQSE
ncbi:MAG TPA: poly-gamma-glutamate hydrolase family protein [Anaerolineaceae bacterium]|nr:poly-gamma-glutamate hydrolase family protein [Anaerolineaceae bacterium]